MVQDLDRLRESLADRYAIERELGSGGMATVYLAMDRKHHRQVAIKVLRSELAAILGPERFLREIEIAAALTHPNILPVHDSGQIGNTLYYVMPFVEGQSLQQRLEREERIPLAEALQIAREVAGALDYAHRHGVVHRDIKPANILLADGHAVVADFGIARAVSAAGGRKLTQTGAPIGTPAYMSPEQAQGEGDVDGRSDIYSLARVLYEMLVGRLAAGPTDHASAVAGRLPATAPAQPAAVPRSVERALARALAHDPADRFQTAGEFAAALGAFSVARPPRRAWLAIAAVALVVAVAASVLLLPRPQPELDPDVLAIAPFDVLDPDLGLWREGLADMLASSLDGAGTLRTVPPSVVVRRWHGRADPVAARDLGSGLGAGLVLYGRLIGIGADSARVVGTLLDVSRRRPVAEFDLRDRADRVDRLADTLAMHVMDELSRIRGFSGWRLASLGSSSPAAIKAFLQGEQHYRRFNLDSAQSHFERAIALDSTFALAYSRRAMASGWNLNADPDFTPSLLRAGALNHGLARRESLLLAADSIRGAVTQFVGDSAGWAMLRRLLTTLELATRQYPSDPQSWYDLGEARYHEGRYIGATDEGAFDAFSRAVALDSTFVLPYRHLVELTLLLRGPDEARRVVDQYIARSEPSLFRDAAQVTAALLDPERRTSAATQAALQALPPEGLYQVWYDLKWWTDSAETATRVARRWVTATDSNAGLLSLAVTLAYRGHLQEAYALTDGRAPSLFAALARLGGVPRDTANVIMAAWLHQGAGVGILNGHRWWAEQGDTTALKRAVAFWNSLAAAGPAERQPLRESLARSARAYLALARHDTAQALHALASIPSWPSLAYVNYYEQLTRAHILSAVGRDREAAELLDRMPFSRQWAPTSDAIVVELERGRVHERLGHRSTAVEAYSAVTNAWRDADPILQPLVEEAKEALGRLAGEPPR